MKNGFKIIVRNFRCEVGEIDIIAREGKTLVFVEVKTRAYDDPTPEDQVNFEKQRQLTNAAKLYLSRYGSPQPPARFDVVAVVWPKRRLSLNIAADTDYYVLYTPPGEDFFCFEPVDHPINAMNLAGGASENGMTLLGRGERLTRTFRFTVERTGLRSMPGARRR